MSDAYLNCYLNSIQLAVNDLVDDAHPYKITDMQWCWLLAQNVNNQLDLQIEPNNGIPSTELELYNYVQEDRFLNKSQEALNMTLANTVYTYSFTDDSTLTDDDAKKKFLAQLAARFVQTWLLQNLFNQTILQN